MSDRARVWAIVPAAGSGYRFGGTKRKQYLPLLGRPVIAHVLSRLFETPGLLGISVAVAADDADFDSVVQSLVPPSAMRLMRIEGGAERAHSVMAALERLRSAGACEDDLAMVHDAVRPCVASSDIERVVEAARAHPHGAVLAEALSDTIKRSAPSERDRAAISSDEPRIEATVDRSRLWRALTPQVFPLAALYRAYRQALAAGIEIGDEARAMESVGASPVLVEANAPNPKITRPKDLALCAALLQASSASLTRIEKTEIERNEASENTASDPRRPDRNRSR